MSVSCGLFGYVLLGNFSKLFENYKWCIGIFFPYAMTADVLLGHPSELLDNHNVHRNIFFPYELTADD